MSDRPLLLFPEPENANRTTRQMSFGNNFAKPTFSRQFARLTPAFTQLTIAFEQKNLSIQNSTLGLNPEYALVFEVIGGVDSFYRAVKKVEGLEWMFDQVSKDIEPDDDFYLQNDDGEKTDDNFDGRVYCVMSNKTAMDQLMSMWKRFSEGEENVFPHGTTPLRDVFLLLKSIRPWDASDRIYETNAIKYWEEILKIDVDYPVPFEIELFFRKDEAKRSTASTTISNTIQSLGGAKLQECVILDISYHAMLVSLPRNQIRDLVSNYNQVSLVHVDDIMFFRPTAQSAFYSEDTTISMSQTVAAVENLVEEPIIAIFDGMPMQNHSLLKDRLILDDPDDFGNGYQVADRKHGTSMASLVLFSDLNNLSPALIRKVYFRPIMKPVAGLRGNVEKIPESILVVDLIHRAVKRILEGEGSQSATAPTVKVINLSIGDPYRQFATTMSPLSRLLDWLSFNYKILFIISAGNQNVFEENFIEPFSTFKSLPIEERSSKVFECLANNKPNIRVLSPAESINNITVGALYNDSCTINENARQAFAVADGYPSPISGFGYGYNKIITPDLFYIGGRKFLVENSVHRNLRWINNTNEPGCKSAYPYSDGSQDGIAYTFGTSDATSMLSHEAGRCYELLNDVFLNENGMAIPNDQVAILIKSMLAHGASWDDLSNNLAGLVNESEKKLSRWIGNGIPNITRVEKCAKNRVTLIGLGDLIQDEAHLYRLPLPFNFSSDIIRRRLTVTLAYMAPTNPTRHRYRTTQIWFEVENCKELVPTRQNSDWQNVRKGTLQHEVFTGENAAVWGEDNELRIKVNCKEDAEKFSGKIPYSIFVTFEVAEGVNLDIYTNVATKIRTMVRVQNQI